MPRSPPLSPEHDPCAEYTVLIGKRTCPAGALRDVADGLKAHAVPLPLGGAKDAVFFLHRTVEWVFDLDEQQTRGVKIGSHRDLPPDSRSAQAGLQRVFQQV